jgi:hypothetical protein
VKDKRERDCPGRPFWRHDPHEVGQALLPATAALLDRDQVEAASLSEGRGAACAGSSRDGVDMQGADAVVAHLVRNDPERGHLGLGEPGGEGRGHRPGGGQVPAPGNFWWHKANAAPIYNRIKSYCLLWSVER